MHRQVIAIHSLQSTQNSYNGQNVNKVLLPVFNGST